MNELVINWVLIAVCFITYFIVSMVYKKLGVSNLQKAFQITNGLRFLNLRHILGIVLFGILSYIFIPELQYLLYAVEIPKMHVLILFVFTFFLSAYVAYVGVKKQFNVNKDSNINYGFANAWFYFVIRFFFLLGYEFFFRGVLLFKFLEFTTLPLAILYSTILYVVIHSFDSKKEILGAIPFGIVLCLFAYYTNSVWYAFLIHLALSSVFELVLFYHLTLKNKIIS